MIYLIHAKPVHPSLCLRCFNPAVYYCCHFLLLSLFYCYYCYKTVATDNLCRARLFPGAGELTIHLLRLINILWLPLCQINKFGLYFPRRLLRSPILVGHQVTILVSKYRLAIELWVVDWVCCNGRSTE